MLTQDQRDSLAIALASKSTADAIADAIDSGSNPVATDVAAISTADATDLASAEALANQTKTTVNAILVALKAAGLMA